MEEITINLDEVKEFVENPSFHMYLLENTPSFETAAFILQTLLDKVKEAAASVDNIENI